MSSHNTLVCRACATPDFHPGDAGIAIGSVVETVGQVIPAALGSDINCGMRLHVADLTIDQFLATRDRFVELIKGDYFFGTRDVTMTAKTMQSHPLASESLTVGIVLIDRFRVDITNPEITMLLLTADDMRSHPSLDF